MEEQILKLFKNYPSDILKISEDYRVAVLAEVHEDVTAYVLLKMVHFSNPSLNAECVEVPSKQWKKFFPIVVKASEDLVYITRLFDYLTGVSPI